MGYMPKQENVNKLKSSLHKFYSIDEAPLTQKHKPKNITYFIRKQIKDMFNEDISIFQIKCTIIEDFGAYECSRCGMSDDAKYLGIYISKKQELVISDDCRMCRGERIRNHYKRKENSQVFTLQRKVRAGIANAFRLYVKDSKKGKKTANILGLDWGDFYKYLLDNSKYNKVTSNIHLDHIIPISSAKTEEEVYILNHYSNFQLLSKKDNLDKKNKYVKLINIQRVLLHTPYKKEIENIIKRENFEIV